MIQLEDRLLASSVLRGLVACPAVAAALRSELNEADCGRFRWGILTFCLVLSHTVPFLDVIMLRNQSPGLVDW